MAHRFSPRVVVIRESVKHERRDTRGGSAVASLACVWDYCEAIAAGPWTDGTP